MAGVSRGRIEYLSGEYIRGYTAGILVCQHWFERIMDSGVRISNKKAKALLDCMVRDRELLREDPDACIVMSRDGTFRAVRESDINRRREEERECTEQF